MVLMVIRYDEQGTVVYPDLLMVDWPSDGHTIISDGPEYMPAAYALGLLPPHYPVPMIPLLVDYEMTTDADGSNERADVLLLWDERRSQYGEYILADAWERK